ncbi:TPA: hypothetical protein NKQ41_003306 [Vibrio parahaemolyticus]|uniref:hypothetical protein n=1 Tax=Vibrio parahaemolyticus TaxID=670 RepID=UPI00215C3FD8|nr:hypothetical protein [Vibrio parahaemolyticus]MCR9954687.1 hypothetical protein [Vibrio parahaemolyticus]HCH1623314.1 hypothetical protein [Vibrio parahaemolyticus]
MAGIIVVNPNKKMDKRLEWINPKDLVQVTWLRGYVERQGWLWANQLEPRDWANNFINTAKGWDESPETRERCRNMKAAWKSWEKREQNKNNKALAEGAYTISIRARRELERLAKIHQCNFSQVIDTLLLTARDIERLQKHLKSKLKKLDSSTLNWSDDALLTLTNNVIQKQTAINKLEQETERKSKRLKELIEVYKKQIEICQEEKNKLKAMQMENDALKKQNERLKTQVQSTQNRLEQYLANKSPNNNFF